MAEQDEELTRRSRSFGSIAEEYGRLRPAPCDAAVDWLLPPGCRSVLDLAAGAGTLTGLLAERVPEVTAVEPDDRMRGVLAERVPGAAVLSGTAEDVPLPDGRLDAVVVSSAWHWFDPARAVPEIGRVLRPGGRLGVVWNSLDVSVPWVGEWYAGLRPENAAVTRDPASRHAGRGARLRGDLDIPGSPFGEVEEAAFTCTRRSTPRDAAALLGTYSRVILLPAENRAALLTRAERSLREMLSLGAAGDRATGRDQDAGAAGDAEFDLPFRSLCWRATRTAGIQPAP
ncbi:class I SAM-dependent methyltransferase [Actinacidiphila epipremni]|uniref:Class I SAM-dependent methyltransferase n=1 Tax=Actinacidiphila epipremni TaxID=2053013 RepID=A0ABX0ZSU3_9ACTN|nr:class I SAM-dependent methyltransferase [Actinacidiphila epipremni]NJP44573.1 class I SAM-dependent methyltransferase [Actinacidiphila epipremni]